MTWRDVVLLGVGGFGQTWRAAISASGMRVAALIDTDREALEVARQVFRTPRDRCFPSLAAWEGSADVLIDSTPPMQRADRIAAIADRARRFVLAKPAAWTAQEARAIDRAVSEKSGMAFVAMQKRFLPAFIALQRQVREGRIGRPGYLRLDVEVDGTFWAPGWAWRREMAFPSLWEGMVHQLDLALEWLPDFRAVEVSAQAWNPRWSPFPGQADVSALLRGEEGEVIQILSRWSRLRGPFRTYFSGVCLEGTSGVLEVIDGKLFRDQHYQQVDDDGGAMMDLEKLNERLVDHLIRDEDAVTLGLGRHGRVLALLMAVEQSIKDGRTVRVADDGA
ncbi:MAG: Gfo/Idh/MocA family oxidoreductase [Phycisphaerales bacterium]|nr:Gfo/Idh/MocA family oxidoreductase [Hyphomonadaceae bacterium]